MFCGLSQAPHSLVTIVVVLCLVISYSCILFSTVPETSWLWKTRCSPPPAQHSCMTSAFDWCQQAFLEHIGIHCGCHIVHLGCPVPHVFTATHCCRLIAAFTLCSSLSHFSSPTRVGWGHGVKGFKEKTSTWWPCALSIWASMDKDKETLQRALA